MTANFDILYNAAYAFSKLLKVEYYVVLGKAKRTKKLQLRFLADNFYHLSGMHKLYGSYGFQKSSYAVLFQKILLHELPITVIENDPAFPAINLRMQALLKLEAILDNPETVFYAYEKKKATVPSNLNADYVAKSTVGTMPIIFAFFAYNCRDHVYYGDSIFPMSSYDYTTNQTQYTVLLKEKINHQTGEIWQLTKHKNYNASNAND